MSVLTMKVSPALAARLEKVSARRRVPKSQIIREALEKALMKAESDNNISAYDLMKDGFGIVRSGTKDLASNRQHMKGYGK
jgi:predicted DNA-binding protein